MTSSVRPNAVFRLIAFLALEVRNRWTKDAPLSGYSSISLPGYTKGNYLGEDYSHL